MNFLEILKEAFLTSLTSGPRSNAKLKILHGAIAKDLSKKLGDEYEVQSLGFNRGKEGKINGRYIDKRVDVTITKNKKAIAGIAVKFVMSNYKQNSNNYFENMLGETANIRTNNIPYFQIFIISKKMPYYDLRKNISRWDYPSAENLKKYVKMSRDNTDYYFHTPNKTLLVVIDLQTRADFNPKNFSEYQDYFLTHQEDFNVKYDDVDSDFGDNVIINDYDKFIAKIYHLILSL
ncbi:hypothetical protein [Mycoplasmopsis bovigenitalium]|uniref:hypothetical protein n=1 Tax=Mycoplasmopsis bovigenitalium TaxID=2112 RepID=UPI000BBACDDE|nr:hypothetical protein [Mycoplasmopsis bovigenitalium]